MYRVFVHEFYTAWRCYSIASGSLFSEDSREYFSWDLVLGLRFYMNHSSDSPGSNDVVCLLPQRLFPPLRGTNSTTVNHITAGTANSNSNK